MRTLRALIAFLLLVSLAHGAQVITIPEGPTEYGPFSVGNGHRHANVAFQTTTSNFTSMTITIDCFANGAWQWRGTSTHLGGPPDVKPIGSEKQCQDGATQFRVTVTVIGGSVNVAKVPAGGSR